jgi:hypothetical protein
VEREGGEIYIQGREGFSALNVPRQCPFALLAKAKS